jgi:putative oxidoreductase
MTRHPRSRIAAAGLFPSLAPLAPQILGNARIGIGTLMACHGAQKVFGAFGGPPAGAPAWVVWTAGPIELIAGSLLAVGLGSRGAAFLLSGLMAFAYFLGHAGRGFWPILNGGELAIAYCWVTLYLAAQGPGAWALDNLRDRGPAVARAVEPEDRGMQAA